MKFNLIEKKLKLDGETRDYAEKKVGKLDRFFRSESEATVTFSTERGRCRAEVSLNNDGFYYRASELTSDMHASIDSACASIERQIRKNKTRLQKRLRDGALEKELTPDYFTPEDYDEPEFRIVRTKRFPMKPMTPEEAILQMNLLDHEFYAFLNEAESGAFAVVYRRKQGGYGLICDSDE